MNAALLMALASAGVADAGAQVPPLRLEWGCERSAGSLGETQADRVDQCAWSARATPDGWQWGLDVPYLRRQDADGRASGWGDVVLKVSRELGPLTATQTGWDLTVKWKTATGRASAGLGTGAHDAVVQAEWARLGPARWLVFGEVGYRVTGTPPGAAPRRNAWHAELGAQSPWVEDRLAGVFVHAREAVGRAGPQGEVTVYGQQRWGTQQLRAHLTRGNGRGSAAWAAGLAWSQRWP